MASSCYCVSLRKASRRLSAHYDEALAPFGINIAQFSLLKTIRRRQPISLTQLAALQELDRSTVGRNTKVLQRMGLLVVGSGVDQREALLALSDSGAELLRAAEPAWLDVQKTLDEKLGEGGSRQLQQLLDTL